MSANIVKVTLEQTRPSRGGLLCRRRLPIGISMKFCRLRLAGIITIFITSPHILRLQVTPRTKQILPSVLITITAFWTAFCNYL